jgi:hypothetical protein
MWARVVGTGFTLLSMAIQFLIIPLYPIWSLLMIALDVGSLGPWPRTAATLRDRSTYS